MKKLYLILLITGLNGCGQNKLPWSEEQQRRYALVLQERGLYQEAVNAFKELAQNGPRDSSRLAGVYYRAGNICFEDMSDYRQALTFYLKSEISGAQGEILTKVKARIVACLERLGKSYDAQKELDERTRAGSQKPVAGETVVAHIGKRLVTMNEVNEAIRMLPEYVQKEYTGQEKKLEFLRQYIATELMYDSAMRKGFDKDPNIMKAVEQMKKNFMVEALLAGELSSKIAVTDTEIKLYYEAHKDAFKGKTLNEARNEITFAVTSEKKQDGYRELMDRLLHAEQVVIYDEYFNRAQKNSDQ